MAYEVVNTINGPLVKHNERYITLMEHHFLIEVAEEHPEMLKELRQHIVMGIRDGADEAMEALQSDLQVHPNKLFAYANAANQYLVFSQGTWKSYKNAKEIGRAHV